MSATSLTPYPVRVEASLDSPISRWLWLFKWLLAIPHFVVLGFLWIAFVVASAVAFVAILVTGRYPRALFDLNVGVLRWSWRVSYYSYGGLGTDRYPPFTLAEVPDYPAHLEVAYPSQLSRGLVLVKWWLLALPHYLIVGIFAGAGAFAAWRVDDYRMELVPNGLIGLLVLVAAVTLAVTGRYPRAIFDLVLGLNRWVLRVAAYASLMTDAYPPFRLDLGGSEPGQLVVSPTLFPELGAPAIERARPTSAWTAGRVASLVVGSLLLLLSLGLLGAGGVATWADQTQRDASGFVTTGTHQLVTGTYAITSDRLRFGTSNDLAPPSGLLGKVRLRVTADRLGQGVFVGIGPTTAVSAYLGHVSHAVVTSWRDGSPVTQVQPGTAPPEPPATMSIWAARVAGTGTQTLTWTPRHGDWTIVVMNADAHPVVSVHAAAGATLPDLGAIGVGLLVSGAVLLAASITLIALPVRRAGRSLP